MSKYARKHGNRDKNQGALVREFERLGCSVMDLSGVGGGCPDLLVGTVVRQKVIGHGYVKAQRMNFFVEIKNPEGRNRLENSQLEFEELWKGSKPEIVRTVDDVLRLVNEWRGK